MAHAALLKVLAALMLAQSTGSIWTEAKPLLEPYSEIAVASLDDRVYVMGGYPASRRDPRTNSWQSLEPVPTPVHGVTGAAYIDGWIHLMGGGLTRGGSSGSTLHQAFRAAVDCD